MPDLSLFKKDGVRVLKKFGIYQEEDRVWGKFSPKAGKHFIRKIYLLQHVYQTSTGKQKLCAVESSWIPTHPEAHNRKPFGEIYITSPEADVIGQMFVVANKVFDELRRLKEKVDATKELKNKTNLQKICGRVAEMYWMISQIWPYERGTAGIADLITKVIFDWFGVYTPLWKDNANPNIIAPLYT